jgi:hypothetical protein
MEKMLERMLQKEQRRVTAVERKIDAMIAHWEDLSSLEHSARPFVSSIECDHVDTACLSCASRSERGLLGL